MDILLVTPFMPHRRAGHGTATVASRFVEYFAARHSLSILTFGYGPRDLEYAEELRAAGARVRTIPFPGRARLSRQLTRLRSSIGPTPFLVNLFDARSMRDAMTNELEAGRFDLVHIDTTPMGQYVDGVKDRNTKKVLVEIDVSMKPLRRRFEQERSHWRRALHRREWRRMCGYEPGLCEKFDLVYAVSAEDRELLASTTSKARVSVFRYGVDDELLEIPRSEGRGKRILFLGSFQHPPNVDAAIWFHRSILPRVRERVPDVEVSFVGGSPPAPIQRMAGVTVTGWVPSVAEFLSSADVGVVPLRLGGGVKLKTLEMMAAGRAVVTTPVGCEWVRAEDGTHLVVASTAEEFAERVIELLQDPSRRAALGAKARELVRRDHRWRVNLQELERDYHRLVGERELSERQVS